MYIAEEQHQGGNQQRMFHPRSVHAVHIVFFLEQDDRKKWQTEENQGSQQGDLGLFEG